MSSKIAAKSVTKFLTAPSKVAHSLDWRKASGSVLTVRILRDRIDLAVASHPSFQESAQQLPSIPLDKKRIKNADDLSNELSSIVRNYNVAGWVVHWPVREEGWCGAACGRTLHVLDQVSASLSPNRPVCLYDGEHHLPPEDSWGRTPLYAKTSDKDLYVASKDSDVTDTPVTDVWNQFMAEHWPEFSEHEEVSAVQEKRSEALTNLAWLDSYEDTSAYMQAAVL
jgi:hypothetical protein